MSKQPRAQLHSCLSFYLGFPRWWTVTWMPDKQFAPQVDFGQCFSPAIGNLRTNKFYIKHSDCSLKPSPFRARGLYNRSGKGPAGVGWRHPGSLCRRWGPVPDHDCQPPDESLQRPLFNLHQQAGPDGLQPSQGPSTNEVLSPQSAGLDSKPHIQTVNSVIKLCLQGFFSCFKNAFL